MLKSPQASQSAIHACQFSYKWTCASVKFLPDTVLFIGSESIVANHLALQARHKEIHANDHQEDTHEEKWLVVDRLMRNKTANDHKNVYQCANKKCPKTQRTEKSQWCP